MIRIRVFQELSEFCSRKDDVRSENNNCKIQWFHYLLKDINSLRIRFFLIRIYFILIDSWQIRKWDLRAFHLFQSEILSLFCLCMSSDKVRSCDFLDREWFLFLKISSIHSRFSFQIVSLVIFQKIAFDSYFFSYNLLLCHRHKRKKSINHWRISNLLLRSTANLNFSASWLDFDIKESRLALLRKELYSAFNNNRVEKIRSSIHCITLHQFRYWWMHWSHRIVKFSDQMRSKLSSEHETFLQSTWLHMCSDSSIEDHLWHTVVSWIFSDSRQYRICI
jgi:hypothetical protein